MKITYSHSPHSEQMFCHTRARFANTKHVAAYHILLALFLCAYFCSSLFAQDNNLAESGHTTTAIFSEVAIDYKVALSTSMAKAVRTYNTDFKIWKKARFNSELIKSYPYKASQSPSAVFGDFNGDGIIDAVLGGYDKTNELLIAIMSKPGKDDYKAVEIWTKYGSWNSKDIRPDSMTGGDFLLFLHHKGETIAHVTPNSCSEQTLATDAFGIKNFEIKGVETFFPCGDMPIPTSCLLYKAESTK
jgi:hypothetical protein